MERQTINQLVKGALEELAKQSYARTSINNYKRMFDRFAKYAVAFHGLSIPHMAFAV